MTNKELAELLEMEVPAVNAKIKRIEKRIPEFSAEIERSFYKDKLNRVQPLIILSKRGVQIFSQGVGSKLGKNRLMRKIF